MDQNKLLYNAIGMGYYDTVTPEVSVWPALLQPAL